MKQEQREASQAQQEARPALDVRAKVLAGRDARVSEVAEAAGLPPSTLYSLIARKKISSRKVGSCVVIPNAVAREILGVQETAA